MNRNISSISKSIRSANFKQILLLLSIFSVGFFWTTLSSVTDQYNRNLGGEKEKGVVDFVMASYISNSSYQNSPTSTMTAPHTSLRKDDAMIKFSAGRKQNQESAIECQLRLEKYLYPRLLKVRANL